MIYELEGKTIEFRWKTEEMCDAFKYREMLPSRHSLLHILKAWTSAVIYEYIAATISAVRIVLITYLDLVYH
jgi:hypothetical protein